MEFIDLCSVSLAYGRNWALRDISFRCESAEMTILRGPNGAGKSCLFRLLAQLESPTTGSIRYSERGTSRGHLSRSRIGWVGHDTMLYDHLSARENLVFFQQMHTGTVSSEYDLGDWLSQVGLRGIGAKPVAAFSRGMKQRLSIARALIHSPDLVLLDEPWTGIDEGGRERLLEVFEEALSDDRIIVIATHLMSEKVPGCEVRLSNGRLESVTEKPV